MTVLAGAGLGFGGQRRCDPVDYHSAAVDRKIKIEVRDDAIGWGPMPRGRGHAEVVSFDESGFRDRERVG